MTRVLGLFAGLLLCVAVWADGSVRAAESTTFFVSPAGHDGWSGGLPQPNAERTDGPFATLQRACQAAGVTAAEVRPTVTIAPGQYFLDEPVVLTERHNGLTIEAELAGTVHLYGGKRVNGWDRDGQRFYAARLPGVGNGTWDFRALVVDGRYCPRARLPEQGRFEHLTEFEVPWMTTTGGGWKRKPTQEELTGLEYKPDDLGPWLDIRNAEVTVYHMWDESLVGVSAMDAAAHTLTFSSPTGHPPGAFGVKEYVIWNVREGMTQPGQWYLDRTRGKVVYWPLPGEDMAAATVLAPTVESIITLKGTKDIPVRDVTIRRLTLAVTTTLLKAGGFGAGRFAGALSATGAQDCRFVDLEIVHAGGQGLKVEGKDLRIARCHVHHVGACGIRFRGDGVTVTDNHVHDVGLTYPSAIALTGGGSNCRISHNHVHHAPYSAVTSGGQNLRIEHNRIHHAMQQLHDGGGIYCFAGKNLVLRGNFIHDIIDTGGYGASAYYLDERCEGCLVEGNLSVNVARPSHNHMAKGNTIRNNVFINDGDLRLTFPRSSDYTFEKNVLRAGGKILFENFEAMTTTAGNVLFSEQGAVECRTLERYSQVGKYSLETDASNMRSDPGIVSFEQGKVEFAPDSPACKLGIEAIDVSGAGPRR